MDRINSLFFQLFPRKFLKLKFCFFCEEVRKDQTSEKVNQPQGINEDGRDGRGDRAR